MPRIGKWESGGCWHTAPNADNSEKLDANIQVLYQSFPYAHAAMIIHQAEINFRNCWTQSSNQLIADGGCSKWTWPPAWKIKVKHMTHLDSIRYDSWTFWRSVRRSSGFCRKLMTPMPTQGMLGYNSVPPRRQAAEPPLRMLAMSRQYLMTSSISPDSWPLMRMLIPLDGLSLQIERIISCVAAELVATHLYPDTQTKFVKRIAKKLTAILACYPAGEVASMVSSVAAVEHKEMVAPIRSTGYGQFTLSSCTLPLDYGRTLELRLLARLTD